MADETDYTIFYFGKRWSFAWEAAQKARPVVASYLERTQHISLRQDRIPIRAEPRRTALEGLIDLPHHAFFVVPISNSKLGDVYDFMPFYSYQMVGQVPVDVVFVLCSKSGNAADVRSIVTKNTAYQQVVAVLEARGFDVKALGRPNDRSTSEAAGKAVRDASVAAVCSPTACEKTGLKQIGGVLGEKGITTFGIFFNEPKPCRITGRAHAQFPLLLRNANLYTGRVAGGGKVEFVDSLNSKSRLRVKWGIDPLSKELHLGHLACLYKLADFLALDHEVVVVLGTFTGQVGDPSGNLTARPRLMTAALDENAECVKKQIECVLGSGSVRFESNTSLMAGLDLKRLLQWGYDIDARLLLDRRDFRERLDNSLSLSLAEILYGLLQAHDTLVLSVDVEVGGLDQLHNCILMRNIFAIEKRPPPFALLLPLIPGLEGDAKMSAFKGNHVAISESREAIHAKLLSVRRDDRVFSYLRMLTDVREETIAGWQASLADGNRNVTTAGLVKCMADAVLQKLEVGLEGMATS